MAVVAYGADVRTGGRYRLERHHASSGRTMVSHGDYVEVVPGARIRWTNDEGDAEGSVTTVTFEDADGDALVTISDLYTRSTRR